MNPKVSIVTTKIFRNLFFSFSSGVLAIILLFSALVVSMQKDSIVEIMYSEAATLSNSINLVCANAMVSDDDSFIVEHNMDVAKKNLKIHSIIVTKKKQGHIVTKRDGWYLVDTLPQRYTQMEQSTPQFKVMDDEFHYVQPVVISGIDWGWVHISFTLHQYHQKIRELYQYIALLIFTIFLTVLLVSYFVAKYFSDPILKLQQSTDAVANGNFKVRIQLNQKDEISDLARNFNNMISKLEASEQRLKRSHDELEKKVQLRTKELEELNLELDHRVKQELEKNRAQEQLLIQQSRSAAMGEMIGNIAHQWRQPLNALSLVIQNIYYAFEMHELDEQTLKQAVTKSKRLVESMSHTIDDFRNFFQPNKVIETFNLFESINMSLELISASLKSHNISVSIDIDNTLSARGYPNEFSQVILNILSNAKDALIENRIEDAQIMIRSEQNDTTTRINIEDNAGGIDPSVINKVFDPYFSTKEEGKGTGIGLYMSKVIIETNMKGKLHVKNAKQGACFTIELNNML